MLAKERDVVVLFNPSLLCVEQVLGFLKSFTDTATKLHILTDLHIDEAETGNKDVLILELTLSKGECVSLFGYLDEMHPELHKLIVTKQLTVKDKEDILLNIEDIKRLALKNHDYQLN